MNITIAPASPIFLRIGQLAFTAVLIVLLWTAADGPEIVRTLSGANLVWLFAAVGALICQTVLSAWRWKITAAELGQALSLRLAVREYFIGQAVNQALPGGVIGDAARAVRARSEVGLALSGFAVGLERLAGQIAMFVTFTCAFAVTYLLEGGLDWPPRYAAAIGLTIGLVIFAVVCGAILRRRTSLLNKTVLRWLDMAMGVLASRRVLPAQITLGIIITLCNIAAFGFCAWAVGVPLSIGPLFAIVPLILFSMLIPLTVSGWGIREGSAALLLPLAGASVSEAVAASVLFGIAMLLAIIPSFIIMVTK